MSRITNPDTESSVTCGFFNALSNDRTYNANQISELFDGIIRDGIFSSIGDMFVVTANNNNTISVGTGKAWFNHTWTKNDAKLVIDCGYAEILQERIDVIVIEIDRTDAVRDNFIKVIKGDPSSDPVKPTLINSDTQKKWQYPLAYITRPANSQTITQANIENTVGTTETPLVTGVLKVADIDTLMPQWRAKLDEFVTTKTSEFQEHFDAFKARMLEAERYYHEWGEGEHTKITEWFNSIKDTLESDPAVNLELQITDINDHGVFWDNVDSQNENLMPFPFYSMDMPLGSKYLHAGDTWTKNGVTFRVLEGGKILLNGTSTSYFWLRLSSKTLISENSSTYSAGKFILKNGHRYVISGCPDGGGENEYYLQFDDAKVFNSNETVTLTYVDTDGFIDVYLIINSGIKFNSLIFEPRIEEVTTYMNDADTLQGHDADYFISKDEFTQFIAKGNKMIEDIRKEHLDVPNIVRTQIPIIGITEVSSEYNANYKKEYVLSRPHYLAGNRGDNNSWITKNNQIQTIEEYITVELDTSKVLNIFDITFVAYASTTEKEGECYVSVSDDNVTWKKVTDDIHIRYLTYNLSYVLTTAIPINTDKVYKYLRVTFKPNSDIIYTGMNDLQIFGLVKAPESVVLSAVK